MKKAGEMTSEEKIERAVEIFEAATRATCDWWTEGMSGLVNNAKFLLTETRGLCLFILNKYCYIRFIYYFCFSDVLFLLWITRIREF